MHRRERTAEEEGRATVIERGRERGEKENCGREEKRRHREKGERRE